jgi:extracellular factor (EF) 3-hydroxypalmitic acid methyl ester biosynthesis protein
VRFRPARLSVAELSVELQCRFHCDGAAMGPLAVLDLGVAGFAADAPSGVDLAPGTALESVELLLGNGVIWTGAATVVHCSPGRIGARFDSGTIDLRQLQLQATLEGRLDALREQREHLPAEWRAAVSDLRQLLEDARLEVEAFERSDSPDPLRRSDEEAALFDRLQPSWGAPFYAAVASLHEASRSLDARARALGRNYAQSALMPLLYACPMHRRGYEKPQGYAGDYRLMELYFAHERAGDGLFGRFLHSITQGYTLCRAVVGREALMRRVVQELAERESTEPARILSLAAGPAIELRRWLEGDPRIMRPVELLLLDQDPNAHETAHRQLSRLLVERHGGELPVTVTCLHFSVRQILKPQSEEERDVVDRVLAGLDLVYCAGLYDYLPEPVARRLTEMMYARLRPGGRMLLGNLMEAPDTTWIMEYVLDWPLTYRTHDAMLALASGLAPAPARASIASDATGHAIFLDVTRPEFVS